MTERAVAQAGVMVYWQDCLRGFGIPAVISTSRLVPVASSPERGLHNHYASLRRRLGLGVALIPGPSQVGRPLSAAVAGGNLGRRTPPQRAQDRELARALVRDRLEAQIIRSVRRRDRRAAAAGDGRFRSKRSFMRVTFTK